MKVLRSPSPLIHGSLPLEASALTIGNFDGCHRGHQALISRVLYQAKTLGFNSVCLTFDPNPKQFFKPELRVGKLFQAGQKLRALRELGLDFTVIQRFDLDFSQLTAIQFYESLLKKSLRAQAIIVGHDFRFGRNREGTIELLRQLTNPDGALIEAIDPQQWNSEIISSSGIRKALEDREVHKVRELLGRPYLLEGLVVTGKKLGRQLGFPTANLATDDQLLPGIGVYAGFATIQTEPSVFNLPKDRKPCILNIGRRPTVSGSEPTVTTEVHILAEGIGQDALYDQTIGVYLTDFIRPEQKFVSLDALKAQIKQDCAQAIKMLGS